MRGVSGGEVRDEFVDRAVRLILASATQGHTLDEAVMVLTMVRADLAEQIRVARDEGCDPEFVAGLVRLLGRLHDATETGGTRR